MLKKIWLFVCELPQNIIGFIIVQYGVIGNANEYKDTLVYHWKLSGGMSLGRFIFVPFDFQLCHDGDFLEYVKHEYGHSRQSKYLGWLYLLVIGLPSLTWAWCFEWYRKKHNKSYYWFYTERWADKLGDVNSDIDKE